MQSGPALDSREKAVNLEPGGPSTKEDGNKLLPCRLYATDRYPKARLNINSNPSTLVFIHNLFKDTPLFERLMRTCFGRLYEFPAARCPHSGQLIHSLLTRQLLTRKKYEFWTVFGGKPLKFSLPEFGTITGLPCGEYPIGYIPGLEKPRPKKPDAAWKSIVSGDVGTTLGDIMLTLQNEKDMDPERQFKLVLILIVDGVLVAKSGVLRPTPKYVTMLNDVDKFLEFPWGRESFFYTITTMKPEETMGGEGDMDPVVCFRNKLKQKTMMMTGFPLAVQLLAFRLVPQLLSKLHIADQTAKLIHITGAKIPIHGSLEENDVLAAEFDPNLEVIPILGMDVPEEWGDWHNEIVDKKVDYLNRLIAAGHSFSKSEWHGGDASFPLVEPIPPKDTKQYRRLIVDRKAGKKTNLEKLSCKRREGTKIRKISEKNELETEMSEVVKKNERLVAEVKDLSQQMKKIIKRQNKFEKLLKLRSWRGKRGWSGQTRNRFNQINNAIRLSKPPSSLYPPAVSSPKEKEHDVSSPVAEMEGIEFSPPLNQYVATQFETVAECEEDVRSPSRNTSAHEEAQVLEKELCLETSEADDVKAKEEAENKLTPPEVLKDEMASKAKEAETVETNVVADNKEECIEGGICGQTLMGEDIISLVDKGKEHVGFAEDEKNMDDVSKGHMEVLMTWLARRKKTLPSSEVGAFCWPMFINFLLAKKWNFYAAKNKSMVRWDEKIRRYVGAAGYEWGKVIDVYIPMIWDDKHWVGLAINVNLSIVEVLDPNTDLKAYRDVEKYMKPVLDMLPYVVDSLCPDATQSNGLKPYKMSRTEGLYKNIRSRDCGPVVVKFMEMHAAGDPAPHMAGITDEMVDDLRKQYVLDIYKELVIPLYFEQYR